MNELERTALNEILRTVTYIAEKVDEIDSKISLNDSQVPEQQKVLTYFTLGQDLHILIRFHSRCKATG